MTGFLIFYFAFSAIFAVGVLVHDKDDIPLDEFMMGILLGWLLLPFGLGMAIGKFFNTKEK